MAHCPVVSDRSATQHAWRLGLVLGGLMLSGRPAHVHAQEVFGVLRTEMSGMPAEGVVLAAMRVSDRTIVGRTLSGSAGAFRLRVGSDSIRVMALRIGQQPVELWQGALAVGARLDIGRTLPERPVSITTLRVRERARCGAAVAGESSVTRALFADALTALMASLGSIDGEALVVRTATVDEFRDLRDQVLRTSAPTLRAGASAQPFRSVPVTALMRDGFVVSERDGSMWYRAPDAHVLTSDLFLAQYCLSLDRSRDSEGLVGIRFVPQRTRHNHVGVRGTVWLDRPTRTLRRLDFGYVGLSPVAASASPGGTVEYAQLAGGRWIIDRWSLRMPSLSTELVASPSGSLRAPRQQAVGVQVTRGMVLEAKVRGAVLYTVGGAPAERDLIGANERTGTDETSLRAPVRSARTDEGDTPDAPNGLPACEDRGPMAAAVAGVVLRATGTAVAGALVDAEWSAQTTATDNRRPSREQMRVTATTDQTGRFWLCGIPRDVHVVLQAHTSEARSRTTQLRLPASGAAGTVELVLQPTRFGLANR